MARAHSVGALGADAVITLPATAGTIHTVHSISASYSGVPLLAGNLQVSINGSVVYDMDLAKAGTLLESSQFDSGINEAIEIRLNGIIGLGGKVNCQYTDYVP